MKSVLRQWTVLAEQLIVWQRAPLTRSISRKGWQPPSGQPRPGHGRVGFEVIGAKMADNCWTEQMDE
jgi:hypothetical protein